MRLVIVSLQYDAESELSKSRESVDMDSGSSSNGMDAFGMYIRSADEFAA